MKLSQQDLDQLQGFVREINWGKFKVAQIKANTALVPRGQEVAAELEAINRLVENAKNQWIADVLTDMGCEKGKNYSVDSATGDVTAV